MVVKFRLWDGDNKLLGYEILRDNSWHYSFDGLTEWFQGFKYLNAIRGRSLFTGSVDRNGKEVYADDIVDWGYWDTEEGKGAGERAVVEYDVEKGAFVVNFYSKWGGEGCDYLHAFKASLEDNCTFVVIGNIRQNPELSTIR